MICRCFKPKTKKNIFDHTWIPRRGTYWLYAHSVMLLLYFFIANITQALLTSLISGLMRFSIFFSFFLAFSPPFTTSITLWYRIFYWYMHATFPFQTWHNPNSHPWSRSGWDWAWYRPEGRMARRPASQSSLRPLPSPPLVPCTPDWPWTYNFVTTEPVIRPLHVRVFKMPSSTEVSVSDNYIFLSPLPWRRASGRSASAFRATVIIFYFY